MKKKVKVLLINCLLALVFFLLVLLASEALVRFFCPEFIKYTLYQPNRYYGWMIKPNLRYRFSSEAGGFTTRTNSKGLREDREYPYEKPSGVYRILLLGDSFTEAGNVPIEEAYPYKLESMLSRVGAGVKFEVITAGTSGFSTDNEYLFYRYEGRRYRPDLVVLQFCPENDIMENSYFLSTARVDQSIKPYFEIKNGGLILRNFPSAERFFKGEGHLGSMKRFFCRHFRLYNFIGDKIKDSPFLAKTLISLGMMRRQQLDSDASIIPLHYFVYSDDYRKEWLDAWEITEALLLKLRNEVREDGSRLLVVIGTAPGQVHPEIWNYFLNKYPLMKNKAWDLDKPGMRIQKFCSDNGIEVLDLSVAFKIFARSSGDYLHFPQEKAHWSIAGHALAAECIYSYLLKDKDFSGQFRLRQPL